MEPDGLKDMLFLRNCRLLYEPLLEKFEKITTEQGWDCKTIDAAYDLIQNITDSTFLVVLTVHTYKTFKHNVTGNIHECH